ncbi:MAG: hypothetical protein LBV45_08140 [Xanthomonadaceae bacterium]|nr:hypothetical protein [Xanthomonadaceae bacterium]
MSETQWCTERFHGRRYWIEPETQCTVSKIARPHSMSIRRDRFQPSMTDGTAAVTG